MSSSSTTFVGRHSAVTASISISTKRSNIGMFQLRRRLQNKNSNSSSNSSCIDSYALLRALKSLNNHPNPSEGIQIHQLVISLGFQSLVVLQTALLTSYSQSGLLQDAQQLFDEIPHRTLVTWTALISAYTNNQRPRKALELFRQMQLERVQLPDIVTLTVALSACADLGALDAGEWIHTYIRKQGLGEDLILTNALINMYCKCGDIDTARELFEIARQRDVTTWTSIISGYALHGRAREALELFDEMRSRECRPNSVTFVGVLTACSHAGLVEEGKRQWENMTRCYSVKPNMAHYGCMVDLLCRAGQLEEAYGFIQVMPVQANAVIWRTLLGACSLKGNVSIGNHARKKLLELEPECVEDKVSMSNTYAKAGMWEEKEGIRRRKGRRAPGCSLIEVGTTVHEFVAGDRRQVKAKEIQQVLEAMVHCSKDAEAG